MPRAARKKRSQGPDYVLALKGNHGDLHDDVIEFFKMVGSKVFQEFKHVQFEEVDSRHGRVETHKYWLAWGLEWLAIRHQWRDLQVIGIVAEGPDQYRKALFYFELGSQRESIRQSRARKLVH